MEHVRSAKFSPFEGLRDVVVPAFGAEKRHGIRPAWTGLVR